MIARDLGLHGDINRSAEEVLRTALHDKRVLLVLDNLEQITPLALQLARLLAACRMVKMLVTSREVLHIDGEQCFTMSPLFFPDPHDLRSSKRSCNTPQWSSSCSVREPFRRGCLWMPLARRQ